MGISKDEMKKRVAFEAIDSYVSSGMKLGMGSGSTMAFAIERLAQLVNEGKLTDLKVIPTSFQTQIGCHQRGIRTYSLNDPEIQGEIDLSIDGADEVSPEKHLIKGGGAALVPEKLVEYNSKDFVVIVDQSKIVDYLNQTFDLPVEVIPESYVSVIRQLKDMGGEATVRMAVKKAGPVISDQGNLILDVKFTEGLKVGTANDPIIMEKEINSIPGVLGNGLFTRTVKAVLVSKEDGSVETLT